MFYIYRILFLFFLTIGAIHYTHAQDDDFPAPSAAKVTSRVISWMKSFESQNPKIYMSKFDYDEYSEWFSQSSLQSQMQSSAMVHGSCIFLGSSASLADAKSLAKQAIETKSLTITIRKDFFSQGLASILLSQTDGKLQIKVNQDRMKQEGIIPKAEFMRVAK